MRFENGLIFVGGRFVSGGFSVEDGRFAHVLADAADGERVDLRGARVIPGLVDVHTHGNSGADFSDGDYDGLVKMAAYLAKNGVTSFAPASMTLPYDVLETAFRTAVRLHRIAPKGCARLLGNAAEGLRRIADVAPELSGAVEFTRRASEKCTVSVAHTDASYEEAAAVFDAGATHLTHLYNAKPGIHHRQPGPIGAASERESVTAELICDGHHVHPSAVRMAFRLFPNRVCLISDALRCCGMPDGQYTLGGQDVFLAGGVARLSDGTIAGSAANLYDCMRNAAAFGVPVEQAVLAATAIPAREIGRAGETGSIADGLPADFVVCDDTLARQAVYLGGERL